MVSAQLAPHPSIAGETTRSWATSEACHMPPSGSRYVIRRCVRERAMPLGIASHKPNRPPDSRARPFGGRIILMDQPRNSDSDISVRLRALAQLANEPATERDDLIEVTLTVGGIVVTGILTSEERFRTWSKGVLSGAASTDEEIPPLGQLEIIDRRSEKTNQPGKGAVATDTLFLRNAYILTAPTAGRFSFFLVEIQNVAGFAFGYRPPRG